MRGFKFEKDQQKERGWQKGGFLWPKGNSKSELRNVAGSSQRKSNSKGEKSHGRTRQGDEELRQLRGEKRPNPRGIACFVERVQGSEQKNINLTEKKGVRQLLPR